VGGALFCNLKLGTESVIDRALGFSGTLPQRKTSVGPDFGRCRTTHRNTESSNLGAGKLSNRMRKTAVGCTAEEGIATIPQWWATMSYNYAQRARLIDLHEAKRTQYIC
jgi:hypothetical protein